jgi:hypothetical protein
MHAKHCKRQGKIQLTGLFLTLLVEIKQSSRRGWSEVRGIRVLDATSEVHLKIKHQMYCMGRNLVWSYVPTVFTS